jgi:hypothetical protein
MTEATQAFSAREPRPVVDALIADAHVIACRWSNLAGQAYAAVQTPERRKMSARADSAIWNSLPAGR